MKRILLLFILTSFLISCQKKLSQEQSAQLWKAYHEQNYFSLNKLVSNLDSRMNSPQIYFSKLSLAMFLISLKNPTKL